MTDFKLAEHLYNAWVIGMSAQTIHVVPWDELASVEQAAWRKVASAARYVFVGMIAAKGD